MKTLIPQQMTDAELAESLCDDPFHEYRLGEYQRRQIKKLIASQEALAQLLNGHATLAALKRSVNDLVSAAPKDHDILIVAGDLAVHKVSFIEPHTFLFEGIDQNGHHAGVVTHYTHVSVRVIYRPKSRPDAPRIITGFSPHVG